MHDINRIEKIYTTLQRSLSPTKLEIIDDGHKHIGHPGAESGAGHFTVIISSPLFTDKSAIDCHRLIYQNLDELMGTEIHALKIKII